MGLLTVTCDRILHTWSLKSILTWSLRVHCWLVPDSARFHLYTRESVHSRPVDIKVGNHPHGLSPCGKPIDCAHSAVLQSGDLLGFVERVVHVMQTEICQILHSHSPLLSSAWAFGCGKKRKCTANMLTSHNLPPCDTLYFVGGSAWGWYIRHHTAVQCRSIYHARPIPSRGKKKSC